MQAQTPPHIGAPAMPARGLVTLDLTATFALTDAARDCVAFAADGQYSADDLKNGLFQQVGVAASLLSNVRDKSTSGTDTFSLREHGAKAEVKLAAVLSVTADDMPFLLGLAVNAQLVGSAAAKKITGHNVTEENLVAVADISSAANIMLLCMRAAPALVGSGTAQLVTEPAPLDSFTNLDAETRAHMTLAITADSVVEMATAGYSLAAELLAGGSMLPPDAEKILAAEMPELDFEALKDLKGVQQQQVREMILAGGAAAEETLSLATAIATIGVLYGEAFRQQEYTIDTTAKFADYVQTLLANGRLDADAAANPEVKTLLGTFLNAATAKTMTVTDETAPDVVTMPSSDTADGRSVSYCMATEFATGARDQLHTAMYAAFGAAVASCPSIRAYTRGRDTKELANTFIAAVERQTNLNKNIISAISEATRDPNAPGYVPTEKAYDYDSLPALDAALAATEMRYDEEYVNFARKLVERMCARNVTSYVFDTHVCTEIEAREAADAAEEAGMPRTAGFADKSNRSLLTEQPRLVAQGGWGTGGTGADCENAALQIAANHSALCQTAYPKHRRGLQEHQVALAQPVKTANLNVSIKLRNAIVRVAQSLAVGTCLCTVRGAQIADARADEPQPVGLHMVGFLTGTGTVFHLAREGKRDAGMQFNEMSLNSPNFFANSAKQLPEATLYDLHLGVHSDDNLADIVRTSYNHRHNPAAVPGVQIVEGTGPASTGALSDAMCDTCSPNKTSAAVALQRRMAQALKDDQSGAVSAITSKRLGLTEARNAQNMAIYLPACNSNTMPVNRTTVTAAKRALELNTDAGDFYKDALSVYIKPIAGARFAPHIDPETARARGIDPDFLAALNDPAVRLATIDSFKVGTTVRGATQRGANIGTITAPATPGRKLALWPGPRLSPSLTDSTAVQQYQQQLNAATKPTPDTIVGDTEFSDKLKQLAEDAKPSRQNLLNQTTAVAKHFVVSAAASQDKRARDLVLEELSQMTKRFDTRFAVTSVETIEPLPGKRHAAGIVFTVHAEDSVLSETDALKSNLQKLVKMAEKTRGPNVNRELQRHAQQNVEGVASAGITRRAQQKAAAHLPRDAAAAAAAAHTALAGAAATQRLGSALLHSRLDTLDLRAAAVAHNYRNARTAAPLDEWMTSWVAAAPPTAAAAPREINIAGVTFMCTEKARAVLACFATHEAAFAETAITTEHLGTACDMDELEIDDLAVTALLSDPGNEAYVKLFDEVGTNRVALTAQALALLHEHHDALPLEAVW